MASRAASWQRVRALAGKETRHVLRDPRTLYLSLAMPVVMLMLFGYGVSFDVEGLPLVVVDQDNSSASRALARRLTASGEFTLVEQASAPARADELLRGARVTAALVVPRGFARELGRGGASLQLLVDGADGNTAQQALVKARALVASAQPMLAGVTVPLSLGVLTRFNPASRSALFIVPGLIGYLLAIVAVLLTALTVAREWERGSMEQLFATPVGRFEIIVGKLAPYLAIGGAQVLLVLVLGAWLFDVPARGSLGTLALASFLFLVGMLGQGLLVSVIAKNQLVATQVATMTSVLPTLLLSGFIFPINNMPLLLQALSAVIPARYFVQVLRGVLLRGAGLGELWEPLVALALFGVVVLALATRRFQRRLA